MIVYCALAEGDRFMGYEASALAVCDCYKTGILTTKYAGDIEPAGLMEGQSIVYDFILKAMGHCPIRYVRDYSSQRFEWA